MKTSIWIALIIALGLFGAFARSAESKPPAGISPAEHAAILTRLEALEEVVVRDAENVELRAPSFYGSASLADNRGMKIVEVRYSPGIPNDFQAIGFFGRYPMSREVIQGDWNSGAPDEPNQCLILGMVVDALGDNLGYGLFGDNRQNY